ncbi:MAG: hypothetical protein EpisKO_33180 [Epibacterium sp.]
MVLPTPSLAFEDFEAKNDSYEFGDCTVEVEISFDPDTALIRLRGFPDTYASATYWEYGRQISSSAPISETSIADCLNIDSSDVTLTRMWAVGASFDETREMGFSFELNRDAQTDASGNYYRAGSYTYHTKYVLALRLVDLTGPVLTPPATQSATTDAGKSVAALDVTSLGSGADDVDSSAYIVYRIGTTTLTGAYDFPIGETTVTMDATDNAGNAATQVSFTVSVSDGEAPVLIPPDARTADTDSGKTTASLDVTDLGSVSDNVDGDLNITYKVGDTTLTGAYDFPIGETTVTMDATDNAGNAATQVSFTVSVSDGEAPVLIPPDARTADTDSGKTTASLDVTDLGSVSDNVDGDLNITYKVGDTTLTGAYDFPIGETTVTMDATDNAGNAATQASFTVRVSDGEAPVLIPPDPRTADTDSGKTTASLDVTDLGSVSDNVDGDLSITYKVGDTTLTGAYDFPIGETTVTMDAIDNAGNAATQASFTVRVSDGEAPVLIPPDPRTADTDSGKTTASLDVTGLGSVSDNVDGELSITYKVGDTTLTGAYDFPIGEATVTMDAIDNAGNAATQVSFTVTVTATATTDDEAPVLIAPDAQTAETDENADIAALDVTGLGSVSDNVDGDLSITYKVGDTTLTGAYDFPIGETTVTMDATDSAGNTAKQVSFTVTVTAKATADDEAPVLIAPDAQTAETDENADIAALDVTGLGSVSDNVDGDLSITYKVGDTTLTGAYDFPIGETTVTMDATDNAGNAATQVSFTVTVTATATTDDEAPVLIAPDAQTAETDENADKAALDVTGLGSVSDNVDGDLSITYKVGDTTLTGAYDFPIGETTVTMDATDSAGNAATQVSFTVTVSDATPPPAPTVAEVTINPDKTLTVFGTTEPGATVTVTFPDGTRGTTTASGGAFGTAARPENRRKIVQTAATGTFTVTSATPQPSGDVAITATDANGNTSGASLVVVDTTPPEIVISGAPERLTHKATFAATITFSEIVTGFEASDIAASNAIVTALSGSGAIYTAMIASTGTGDVSLSVPAGAAQDAAGNVTIASNTLVVTDTTVEETQKTIASFLYGRANQLIANQPDLTGFLSGPGSGALDAAVTRGQGRFDLTSGTDRNLWFRVKGAWTKDGTADSSSAFGAIGSHIHLRETLLVGAMLQVDHLSQDDGAARVEGTGWLVGPYVVAKMPDDPLYFEARLLYGRSSNSVSPFGTYTDDFDTTRLLAQVKVTGEYTFRQTVLSPYLNAAYARDDQDAYSDTLGNVIAAQRIDLTQIAFGFDVTQPIAVRTGDLELRGGISGIWSSTSGTAVAETVLPGYAGWRGKLDIGVSHVSHTSGTFTASAFLDGLGASDYESYGLSVGYTLTF